VSLVGLLHAHNRVVYTSVYLFEPFTGGRMSWVFEKAGDDVRGNMSRGDMTVSRYGLSACENKTMKQDYDN